MDLWVIECIGYDGNEIKAICSTRDKAEMLRQKKDWKPEFYRIAHWILDGNE